MSRRDPAARVKAIEQLLTEAGLIDEASIDAAVEMFEENIGPHIGARLVARAWTDADFKSLLLTDAAAAMKTMDSEIPLLDAGMVVVENTPGNHNLIVCTLCSCYPNYVLGLPPRWYKSEAYRSRAVSEPRGVLDEFGVQLPDTTAVHVWDSTADKRYMVLPERPQGTGHLDEDALAELVTRDAMVGCALVTVPSSG